MVVVHPHHGRAVVVAATAEDGSTAAVENTSHQEDARVARKSMITTLRSVWALAKLPKTPNGSHVMLSTINLSLVEQASFNLIPQTR